MRRAMMLLLLPVLAACQPSVVGFSRTLGQEASRGAPVLEKRRTWFDAGHTRLRSETDYLVQPDGLAAKHGTDREWYPDGAEKYVRAFHHGEPTGAWSAWFPSGQLRSESFHGPSAEPRPARWWYEDGTLSTEGLTLDGVRTGLWRAWHPDGTREYEGSYRGGRLHGAWTYWNPDGSLKERGEYEADERVGTWEFGSSATAPMQ